MRIRNLSQFSAYSVIGTVTLMPLLVLPAMVGVLVDEAGMSEPFAGWVASFNFFGGALIALLMALRIHRLDLRRIAMIGLCISILADTLSAFVAAPDGWFLLLRFVTGLAAGSAHIAALAAFARHEEVERGYGLFVTLQFIVSGLGLYVLPVYASELGVKGMYLMFALLGLLSLTMIRSLPGKAIDQHAGAQHKSELTVLLALVTVLSILGYGLFEAANTAQFTYVERFGISIDLSHRQIGTALMIASLIGIPGAFTIVIIGHRFGRLGPLAFGLGTAIAGLLMLIGGNSFAWYFAGSCCLGFAWAFCLPYIQSLMAALDPHGSAIAAGSSAATIGGAAGPGLAALIVGSGNYRYVFLLSIVLFLIAISCFLVSERRAPAAQTAV
ncbi:MAG: MFS transporter [Gammaproteobacteria bacterium]|nr:MFS transporter [Gammaproteobacteria bacterium]MDH4314716.1 MFS transporter [Gammaproteobacteria bacterium]MDH5214552.1 MFS transporter [Gammaproteobacteria bacterium]